MICTFFGHRNYTENIESALGQTIQELIVNRGVDRFYVGNQGKFDACVRHLLKDYKQTYPHIDYAVVLAYMPSAGNEAGDPDSIIPDGLETVHPRYAIDWRNQWMVKQADVVVVYVTHPFGGASKFAELAKRKGKTVINIAKADCADQSQTE